MPQARSRNHRCTRTFSSEQAVFRPLETKMMRVAAAILAGMLSVSTAAAQSTAASGDKPETACTTSPAATTGSGEEKTANSMAMGKGAVLPDAGGTNSAAPYGAERRQAAEGHPDCPPDSKPKVTGLRSLRRRGIHFTRASAVYRERSAQSMPHAMPCYGLLRCARNACRRQWARQINPTGKSHKTCPVPSRKNIPLAPSGKSVI